MKRFYLSLIFTLAVTVLASSVRSGAVTHTYMFDAPQVQTFNGQTVVILEGARIWGNPGAPLLPQAALKLLLPPGEEAISIMLETAAWHGIWTMCCVVLNQGIVVQLPLPR